MCIHTDNKVSHPWRKHCFLPFLHGCNRASRRMNFPPLLCFFFIFSPPAGWCWLCLVICVYFLALYCRASLSPARQERWPEVKCMYKEGMTTVFKFSQLAQLHFSDGKKKKKNFCGIFLELWDPRAATLNSKRPCEPNRLTLLVFFSPRLGGERPGLMSTRTLGWIDSILVVNGQGQWDLTSICFSGIRRLSSAERGIRDIADVSGVISGFFCCFFQFDKQRSRSQ